MKSDFNNVSIGISDGDYPDLLKNIYDPPKRLFCKGNKNLLRNKNLLTIVGSRQTTTYHQSILEKIISDLKDLPFVIVSGLATGIDGLAHKYALENNLPTIAVLGSCLDKDKIYPKENLTLAKDIISNNGLLISEQGPGTKTQIWHFPKRNRILAGLSQVSIIISGAKKSGTLITAQIAIDEGRDVLALPANINLRLSLGPNELIKNGAQILLDSQDILEIYNIDKKIEKQKIIIKDKSHAKIYSLLQTEPMSLVTVSKKLELPLEEVNSIISQLEIQGLIRFNQFDQVEII
ncbi:DNA-protecting protein DprA [Candidatus Parcubacteria bacterium]|nr:MAG: DNA-protecting protein DprA [Candidatus Parcubacteria bacterium]